MKAIKYQVATEVNRGTEEEPNVEVLLNEKIVKYSVKAEEDAKDEAYNGEYEIVDDGQPEPEPSREEQLERDVAELKEDLDLLLSGVTE